MNILVTGGFGFIGSNYILHSVENSEHHRITNVDSLSYGSNPENLREIENADFYKFVRADINDLSIVGDLMADADVFVHFAAETHVDRSISEPKAFLHSNVVGTYTLLEAARHSRASKFIHISTDEVYGSAPAGWTAEVDFVNWYANNTGGETCNFAGVQQCANYYPPVPGLLMGESYHIIPGTTATSGISFTEDTALKPELIGHSLAANHLGPYSQQGVWQINNAHLSGASSAIFEVDFNGLVSGNALAFTWSNEFRPLSWGLVNVVGANGASWNFYTYDGYYEAFLTPGTYKFSISSPGYTSQSWSVAVSPGQSGTGQNLYLEQSNIPVPEFSAIAVVTFSALAASLYLLRRRRR